MSSTLQTGARGAASRASDGSIRQCFLTFSLVGWVALLAVHLAHSAPSLASGTLFPDLLFDRRTAGWVFPAQILALGWLFALYGFALVRAQIPRGRTLVLTATALACAATLLPPVNSADAFAYIGFGRLAGIHGLNPYLHGYGEIQDPFSSFAWFRFPMPYGPAVLPFFVGAGWLSALHPLAALGFLKLLWLAVHALNCLLLRRLLEIQGADVDRGLFLFACNPLLLFELLANAHNDGLLLIGLLAALLFARRGRGVAAQAAALGALLVKLSGLMVVAPLVVLLWREDRKRTLALGLAGMALVALALKLTLFSEAVALRNLLNPNGLINQNSLHHFALEVAVALGSSIAAVKAAKPWLGLGLVFLFLPYCLGQLARVRTPDDLGDAVAWLLLGLLVGFSAQFYPWYLTWLLPSAALTRSRALRAAIVVFTGSALVFYALPYALFDSHLAWRALRLVLAFAPPAIAGFLCSRPALAPA